MTGRPPTYNRMMMMDDHGRRMMVTILCVLKQYKKIIFTVSDNIGRYCAVFMLFKASVFLLTSGLHLFITSDPHNFAQKVNFLRF